MSWIFILNPFKTVVSSRIHKYGQGDYPKVQKKITRLCHSIWNKRTISKVSQIGFIRFYFRMKFQIKYHEFLWEWQIEFYRLVHVFYNMMGSMVPMSFQIPRNTKLS